MPSLFSVSIYCFSVIGLPPIKPERIEEISYASHFAANA